MSEAVSYEKLLSVAHDLNEAGTSWHHHFFPPECEFNEGLLYKIVLEDEESGESFEAVFSTRPMDELAELEDLFFKRA